MVTVVVPGQLWHMFAKWLIKFWRFHFLKIQNISKYSWFSLTIFSWRKTFFENLNIYKNNIIFLQKPPRYYSNHSPPTIKLGTLFLPQIPASQMKIHSMRKSMLLGISGKTPWKFTNHCYLFIHFGYSILPRSGLDLSPLGSLKRSLN